MKKLTALALITGFLFAAPAVQARHGDGYCPMVALEHAKELNLSKQQKSDLEKIKKRVKKEMEALKNKTSDEVKAVLGKDQAKQYHNLAVSGSSRSEKGKECCKNKKDCSKKDKGEGRAKKHHHEGPCGEQCPRKK